MGERITKVLLQLGQDCYGKNKYIFNSFQAAIIQLLT
jgi:hypothetical protein